MSPVAAALFILAAGLGALALVLRSQFRADQRFLEGVAAADREYRKAIVAAYTKGTPDA